MSELQALLNAWDTDLRRQIRPVEPGSVPYRPVNAYASKLKRCARAIALDMMHPEDDPFDQPIQIERMEQGKEAHHAVLARLGRAGRFSDPQFKVVEQEHRFEVKDRGTVVVTGKMDGRLAFDGGSKPPIEIKSGKSVQGCETIEDLDAGVWTRGYVDQLLAYLYADDRQPEPRWGILFLEQFSGLPTAIRVDLEPHLGRVETFLQRARAAVDARHGRAELPPFIEDRAECRRCQHMGKSCSPPVDFGPGARIISDPELIEAAEIRARNRVAYEEYERADKRLKEALRGTELAILGNFQATGTWQRSTKYEIPDEVKKQYASEDPHGRFLLKIERVA